MAISIAEWKHAFDTVCERWGVEVAHAAFMANKTPMSMPEFLNNCVCCGGNWGGMLLSGIGKLYPDVWNAIPDDMGVDAFFTICYTLQLLGVDTSGDENR